jgi:hypothetical protein
MLLICKTAVGHAAIDDIYVVLHTQAAVSAAIAAAAELHVQHHH